MKLLITILFIVTQLLGNAQSYYSKNITSADGLPDNSIMSIYEDSRGFIWVGTDAGVSRWDGETFITYNTQDGLAGNKIWWIDEDNKGNLWFACFGAGISRFDGKEFLSYTSKDGLVDNSVRVIKYSHTFDCMLMGTHKAISILKDTVFYNFSADNGELTKEVIVTEILEDQNKAVFFGFSGYPHSLKKDSSGSFTIERIKSSWLLDYGYCSSLISSKGDTIMGWGREGVVIRSNDSTREIEPIGQVFGIAEDCRKDIWLASWNGGGAISPPGGLFVLKDTIATRLNSSYSINSIQGWSAFFEKKQNLIFYGTLDKGLYKIPLQYFEYYSSDFFGEDQLYITDIEIDTVDDIWFITDSLFVVWDGNSYEKTKLDDFYKKRLNAEINSTPSDDVTSKVESFNELYKNRNTHFNNIEFDKNNDGWLTIANLGLFGISLYEQEISTFPISRVNRNFVFDEADTLFLCNEWSQIFSKYINFKKSNKVIEYSDSLQKIYSQKLCNYKNEIWTCGRVSGVFIYEGGEFRTITTKDTNINKIVNDICFDTEGYAYLGGSDGRIEILAPDTREKVFEINNQDFHSSVQWLKVSKNMLFAGFSDGLRVYRLADIKDNKSNYQFFGLSEGYSVQIVNSCKVDKDGNIWLGTNDGLVKIVTELFAECKFQPLTTIIQKVEIFNKDVDWEQYDSINLWSGLPLEMPKLDPDQNHISIYFHTVNYNNPNADLYYYKLDGIDKDWAGPTDKENVIYPYLPSGKYKFMVKSKNELSGLVTQPAVFKFTILTPWYKQLWFYVLLAILVVAIFIIAYKIRIKFVKKQETDKRKILERISELETKALQAQMNPHFLFNSINSIQSYILDNDVDEALTYLNSFSKIIRMTLEFVNTKFVILTEVLDYLHHYVSLENMRFDDLFNFMVVCDPEIDPETTLIPPMLLQTIIENSIKHGVRHLKNKGTIKLEIKKISNESYQCIIEDNGVGRIKSAQLNEGQNIKKESHGLKITKERLDILNNDENGNYKIEIIDLYSDTGASLGTRVEITLPLMLN